MLVTTRDKFVAGKKGQPEERRIRREQMDDSTPASSMTQLKQLRTDPSGMRRLQMAGHNFSGVCGSSLRIHLRAFPVAGRHCADRAIGDQKEMNWSSLPVLAISLIGRDCWSWFYW